MEGSCRQGIEAMLWKGVAGGKQTRHWERSPENDKRAVAAGFIQAVSGL